MNRPKDVQNKGLIVFKESKLIMPKDELFISFRMTNEPWSEKQQNGGNFSENNINKTFCPYISKIITFSTKCQTQPASLQYRGNLQLLRVRRLI